MIPTGVLPRSLLSFLTHLNHNLYALLTNCDANTALRNCVQLGETAVTELDMPIKAIAPWFGGKRTLAPRIIQELGEHSAYWEPFCGSLAVLFAKPPCSMETVNDLHGDLVNLARCIQGKLAIELYERLSQYVMHETLFKEAAGRLRAYRNHPAPDAPHLERAVDFFVCSWMGRNGAAGTKSNTHNFCARFTKNGGHAAKRFQSAVQSIPAWHHRLRVPTMLSRDGIELCERIEDAARVVVYCDPPYLIKGAKYVHDFEDGFMGTPNDHERLAAALGRFSKTRVVVSYYDHPALESLYPGWTKVQCPTTKAMVNQGMRDRKGATVAPEVLLINGPSYTEGR